MSELSEPKSHSDDGTLNKDEELCVVPIKVFDSLADSDLNSDVVKNVEASLKQENGFSYPKLCSQLCSLFIDVWQHCIIDDIYNRLRPNKDAPLHGTVLKDVFTATIVPFNEPWSAQLDMSFETAPSGCITCPNPHVFSEATKEAWKMMSPTSSVRFYAEWVFRCYSAFPHEMTHVVQNAIHFHDSSLGGWRSEYGASVLSGPVLIAAVLYGCKGHEKLFPDGFDALRKILTAWQFEISHQRSLFVKSDNGVDILEEQKRWSTTNGEYIPGKDVLDTPGAALFMKNSVGAESFDRFLKLAECEDKTEFEEELIALVEHCLFKLNGKPK